MQHIITLRLDSDTLRDVDAAAAAAKPPTRRAVILRELIRRGLVDFRAELRASTREVANGA